MACICPIKKPKTKSRPLYVHNMHILDFSKTCKDFFLKTQILELLPIINLMIMMCVVWKGLGPLGKGLRGVRGSLGREQGEQGHSEVDPTSSENKNKLFLIYLFLCKNNQIVPRLSIIVQCIKMFFLNKTIREFPWKKGIKSSDAKILIIDYTHLLKNSTIHTSRKIAHSYLIISHCKVKLA